MIDDPLPNDWRELQRGVCRVFNEVGIEADVEKSLVTPRGSVTIDVLGIDKNSVDQITYIVECKNWGQRVPQNVVHGFTTVMHETGANIGFIISRHGFQSGALAYMKNTNIIGLTYLDFQKRYFSQWWRKWFCSRIGQAADTLMQYVEPFNSGRDRFVGTLPPPRVEELRRLWSQYTAFGIVMGMFQMQRFASVFDGFNIDSPDDVESFKARIVASLGEEYLLSSATYRAIAEELVSRIDAITNEFHEVFGRNIFA